MCIYFWFAKMYPITRFILSCELDKAACCANIPADPGIMLATWRIVGLSQCLPLPERNMSSQCLVRGDQASVYVFLEQKEGLSCISSQLHISHVSIYLVVFIS